MNVETNDRKSCAMLIASLVIVSTIGLFRRYIPLSSALLAFFRGLIGGLSLLAWLKLRGRGAWQRLGGRKLRALVLNGAFLGINWILLFEAYNYTTIAKATLCYYFQPTIILLLSPLLFREKLTPRKLLCALLAILGMLFVTGLFGSRIAEAGDLRGILFGLGAAVFYSLVIIVNKKIGEVDTYQRTVVQLLSAAAVLVPYLLLKGDFSGIEYSPRLILLLLVVGVVHTGITYALYFGSMSGLKAQSISMLSYLDPVLALFVSALLLREPLSAGAVTGAVLVIGSALLSEWEPKKI